MDRVSKMVNKFHIKEIKKEFFFKLVSPSYLASSNDDENCRVRIAKKAIKSIFEFEYYNENPENQGQFVKFQNYAY
jgi:hypothetical protein